MVLFLFEMYVNLFRVNKPLSALRFRHVFVKEQETISLKYNHFRNPLQKGVQPTAVISNFMDRVDTGSLLFIGSQKS